MGSCLSYFSIVGKGHHHQGNLQTEEFIMSRRLVHDYLVGEHGRRKAGMMLKQLRADVLKQ